MTNRPSLLKIHRLLSEKSIKRATPSLNYFLELLERLGSPHKKLENVIHVAGTNGKGSVISYLNYALQHAGYKVHATTSPHLTAITERIQLANSLITDDHFLNVLEEVVACVSSLPITYFEYITAVALICFDRQKADFILLETGLGGRHDATNCIDAPLASVFTSISIDHQDVLGRTLGEIAKEKAGIIKPGVPVLTCPQNLEVEEILQKVSAEKGASFLIAHPTESFELGLLGEHQQINAALACAVLENLKIPKETIRKGFKSTRWPGRLQNVTYKGKNVWLDIAHNEGAAKVVLQYLDSIGVRKFNLIFSLKKNRDPVEFIRLFLNHASSIFYVEQPEYALCHEGVTIERAAKELKFPIQPLSLEKAMDHCAEETILITGSTSIVQQFLLADVSFSLA